MLAYLNKLEIFEDALFESGKTSTHRTGITCTLINLNTENGERKKSNWAIFEQLPIYPPLGKSSHISLSLLLFTFTQIHQPPSSIQYHHLSSIVQHRYSATSSPNLRWMWHRAINGWMKISNRFKMLDNISNRFEIYFK